MGWGTRGGRRVVAAAAGLLAVATVAVPRAGGGPLWELCPDKVTQFRDHVFVKGPTFASGPPALATIAADPVDPALVAVTNGVDVQVSDDLGCTWSPGFTTRRPGDHGTVSVVAFEDAHLRAVTLVKRLPVTGPGVYTLRLYLRDGDVESEVDLPNDLVAHECTDTRRCFVRFAPERDLAVGYAVMPGFVDGLLAAVGSTTDGGRTWEVHAGPSRAPVTDLAIDPDDDAHVLAVAGGQLFASHDRGETWAAARVPPLTTAARVVFASEEVLESDTERDAVLVDRTSGGTAVLASSDGGATFTRSDTVIPAEPVRDIAVSESLFGPAVVVAAGGRLFRENPKGGFDTLLGQAGPILQIAPSSIGMWLQRAGSLAFAHGLVDPAADSLRRRPGRILPPAGNLTARPGGGRLHVGDRVTVPPGGTGVGIVTADLGRQPRGLDVYFLMDTSGSMTDKVRPMADAMGKVVDAMNREGIAARFGLGEYGDSSYRYRRIADLGTPPEEVRQRLAGLRGNGCCEYQYDSFYELVTGEGMPAGGGGAAVPPGQQASFQPGALHVVVHATDDDDLPHADGRTFEQAMGALNSLDIRHIGIYPYNGSPRDASNDYQTVNLRRYAQETSTFAPIGGIDCDGDHRFDIPQGEPIACAIAGSTSADAPIGGLIERVLLSLANVQPVMLNHGDTPLGIDITPLDDYSDVDLHEAHDGLEFRVRVTCPPERHGTDVDVPLGLLVGDVVVAYSALPVTCLAASAQPPAPAPPPPPEEDPLPPRRGTPRLFPAVPPAASTPPALAQSTAAAEASSGASSSAHAVQAGMAWAPEDAPQVAAAHEDDVRFVAHRGTPSAVTGAGFGFAFVVALALLYAVEPRVATSLARVRDRRDPRW